MKFTNSAPRDCADVAPQLTALFDGEADAAQTREARAHLLSCPACSRQWLDWTRYRDTFRSEPAPVVPPTLLWRVLIAYRVTAFARPARRRSRLPQVSAPPLRGIEAPLPPRLSAHILARTTRKPNAHVMLTPLQGAPPVASSRFKGRSFSFGRAPLWAAPALALWILLLSRADFNATLPIFTPDAALEVVPAKTEILVPAQVNAQVNAASKPQIVAPIPVATRALNRASRDLSALAPAAASPPSRRDARRETMRDERAATPEIAHIEVAPVRANARAASGFDRAFELALNAGQSDIARARIAPRVLASRARVAPMASAEKAPVVSSQAPAASPTKTAPQPARVTREEFAGPRVTLAALATPISPVRTLSSARLRTAAFSEDSMRPRVAHLSANGRRLARLMPDEDAARLRVSRPLAQAPTLRQVSFGSADNGPKLDELRSAVDDFRASVADDENNG